METIARTPFQVVALRAADAYGYRWVTEIAAPECEDLLWRPEQPALSV